MSPSDVVLPLIDLGDYLHPKSPEDRHRVITEIHDAARDFGFFQLKGHGIPIDLQKALIQSMSNVFNLPTEEKRAMSFLNNPCRRGWEASGDSHREGDALPDAKECFFVGREDPAVELSGVYGPNVWPNLPDKDFRTPVWQYYQETSQLGKTLWTILVEALGHSPSLVDEFAKRPIVPMKMIRYPPSTKVQKGQFGIGAHTDFGGITILFQQPGKEGLEVWHEGKEEWIDVPALEDVYVINCGDMVQRWSGHAYKSARHRVINKSAGERMSCATFWHGDVFATNPLAPNDPNRETVGQLLAKRFKNQYSFSKEFLEQVNAVPVEAN